LVSHKLRLKSEGGEITMTKEAEDWDEETESNDEEEWEEELE
jgi:hypothetical protein